MKTEKEKMLLGELYDANNDLELINERQACKIKCFEYNQLHPTNLNEKRKLLGEILGKSTQNILIEPNFWCDYGYNIEVGDNFYANHNLVVLDEAKVTIGNNVFIAPNCSIYTAGHPLNIEQRNSGLEYAYPVTIGNNVWIGGDVTILPGVTIGDNTTIGAGSVVAKNIESNAVAVGNPCKIIKYLAQ